MTREQEAEWRWLEGERLRLGITIEEDTELCRLREKLGLLVDADFVKGQALYSTMSLDDWAVARAEMGNIEPLRRRLPWAAKFINLPKKRKPRKKKDAADADYLFRQQAAYRDTKQIRAIWRERPTDNDKIEKRSRGRAAQTRCGHIAEWYAMHLWGLGAAGLGDDEAKREIATGRPSGQKKPRHDDEV